METELKSRKHVSLEQLKGLLEYMTDHPDLAKGLTRGRRGKLHSVKLWNQCAKKLNDYVDGADKDGKGWSKYWCDWKYRVRRRALELRALKDGNGELPDGVTSLSEMEETIMNIIGESVVTGVVIKSDPLAEGGSEEDEHDAVDNIEDLPMEDLVEHNVEAKPKRGKKRRHSARNHSDYEDGGPSSSFDRKPRLSNDFEITSDMSEDEARFLRIEKQKMENSEILVNIIRDMARDLQCTNEKLCSNSDQIVESVKRMTEIVTSYCKRNDQNKT